MAKRKKFKSFNKIIKPIIFVVDEHGSKFSQKNLLFSQLDKKKASNFGKINCYKKSVFWLMTGILVALSIIVYFELNSLMVSLYVPIVTILILLNIFWLTQIPEFPTSKATTDLKKFNIMINGEIFLFFQPNHYILSNQLVIETDLVLLTIFDYIKTNIIATDIAFFLNLLILFSYSLPRSIMLWFSTMLFGLMTYWLLFILRAFNCLDVIIKSARHVRHAGSH